MCIRDSCAIEPRFCTFAIRTFFHDAGSFLGEGSEGADASIILDDAETMLVRSCSLCFPVACAPSLSFWPLAVYCSDARSCHAGVMRHPVLFVCDHNSPTPPLQGDNTHSGFVPYARAIIAHIGEFYGCSAADLLTICLLYTSDAADE